MEIIVLFNEIIDYNKNEKPLIFCNQLQRVSNILLVTRLD